MPRTRATKAHARRRHGLAIAPAVGTMLLVAASATAGTWPSQLNLEASASGVVYFSEDVSKYYGRDNLQDFWYAGRAFGLGVTTPVSRRFDVGLRGEYSIKRFDIEVGRPASSETEPTAYFTDHWAVNFISLQATLLGRFPVRTWRGDLSIVGGAAVGFHALRGATYDNTLVPGEVKLSGTGIGLALEAGVDLFGTGVVPVSVLAGVRFASVGRVRLSGSLGGTSLDGQELIDNADGRAALDQNGVYLRILASAPVWRRSRHDSPSEQ